MPRLRANPSRIGGQIRLRTSRRASDLKWLGVIAAMLAATAFEGLPVSGFGRAAIDLASRAAVTPPAVTLASRAGDVLPASSGLLTKVAVIVPDDSAPTQSGVDNEDIATASVPSRDPVASTGLFGRTAVRALFCPWSRPRSHS